MNELDADRLRIWHAREDRAQRQVTLGHVASVLQSHADRLITSIQEYEAALETATPYTHQWSTLTLALSDMESMLLQIESLAHDLHVGILVKTEREVSA